MDSKNAVGVLAALAHESRLVMFRMLIERGPNGMTAGELSQTAGVSATSASFHLKELTRAGLVQSTRDGRFIRYAVQVNTVRALLAFLTEDCCSGHPELCGETFTTSAGLCGPKKKVDGTTDV